MLAPMPNSFDAPHGRPGAFFNPWGRFPVRPADLLRWKLRPNPHRRLRAAARRNDTFAAPLDPRRRSRLELDPERWAATWVGHATYVVEDHGSVVVTDPHWGARALLPPRLAPPGLPLDALPGRGLALLSHDHYDHLDRWTVRRMPPAFEWIVPWGLKRWFERFAPEVAPRVTELDWWESVERDDRRVTFVPAQHWSNRLAHPRFSTLWGGFVVESATSRWYFSGDTGFFGGFAEIARRFAVGDGGAPLDAALLPIGAYEPRWFMKYQHMDPAESLEAFRILGARHFLASHWGVFDLTDEPPGMAPEVLAALVPEDLRARVHVPLVGGRVELDSSS